MLNYSRSGIIPSSKAGIHDPGCPSPVRLVFTAWNYHVINCDQNAITFVLSPLIIVCKIVIITTTNALSIDFGHVGYFVTWFNNRCIIHIAIATSEYVELIGDCVLI